MGRKHITPGEIYAHKIVFIDCYICWGHQVLKRKDTTFSHLLSGRPISGPFAWSSGRRSRFMRAMCKPRLSALPRHTLRISVPLGSCRRWQTDCSAVRWNVAGEFKQRYRQFFWSVASFSNHNLCWKALQYPRCLDLIFSRWHHTVQPLICYL